MVLDGSKVLLDVDDEDREADCETRREVLAAWREDQRKECVGSGKRQSIPAWVEQKTMEMMVAFEGEEEREEARDSAKEDACPYTLSSASPCSHSKLGHQSKVTSSSASELRVTGEETRRRYTEEPLER